KSAVDSPVVGHTGGNAGRHLMLNSSGKLPIPRSHTPSAERSWILPGRDDCRPKSTRQPRSTLKIGSGVEQIAIWDVVEPTRIADREKRLRHSPGDTCGHRHCRVDQVCRIDSLLSNTSSGACFQCRLSIAEQIV